MSSNELDSGGQSNTDPDGDGGGGSLTLQIDASKILPDWVQQIGTRGGKLLVQFVTNPRAFVVALLTTGTVTYGVARERLKTESAVEIIVEQYIFRALLLPIAVDVWEAGLSVVAAVLTMFNFIASIPFRIAEVVGLPVQSIGVSLGAEISEFNRSIATDIAQVGLPAPAVVSVVWAVEFGVLAYALWIGLQVFENILSPVLPIEITDTLRVVTQPIRNLINALT